MPTNSIQPINGDNKKGQLPVLLVYVMLLLSAIKLGIQLWGANKGFDIWDEGLYILMLNFFDQYPTEPHNYYSYVMAALIPLKEYGILPLRYLAIGTETLATLFFAYSMHRFFSYRAATAMKFFFPITPLVLFTFFGAAFLSVYPRAFSYNDFSYFSTLAISGAVMLYFSGVNPLKKYSQLGGLLLLFFIGAILGAQLVVKFSTCILLFAWVLLFIWLFSNQPKRFIIALVLALFAGFASFLYLLFDGYTGFALWLHNLNQGVALLRLLAYEPYYIIVRGYLYVDIVLNGVYFLIPLAIAYITYRALAAKTNNQTTSYLIGYATGIITWLICSLTIHYGFLAEFHYRFIAVHIFTIIYCGAPVVKQLAQQKQWKWLILIAMIGALPFMALLGSSNTATQTLTRYLASWYVLIALFMGYLFKDNVGAMVKMMAFLIAFCIVNYVAVQVYNPYGLNAPLTEQNISVKGLHYLDGIVLDPATANFFEELKNFTNQSGYKQGGPILALGDLCGAVTAMGGYIPETFWYFSDENAISVEHSRNYSCLHLQNLKLAEHIRLPLIYINSGIHSQVIDCLSDSEVPFPEAYYLEGTIFNPYAQESLAVWAPIHWNLPAE